MDVIHVVTISETVAIHANEIDVEAFVNYDDAVSWIEEQIKEKVDTYHLTEANIDGWYVEIDGPSHTIQYDIRECALR
ncbi:MAG: hypothetical protein J6334_08410 [Kiritimatiellae bacterium]|nr:hypothetical protein [Kiritimatiellia bacterium]